MARIEIFKNPKTDNGTKKSAKGLLQVLWKDGRYILKDQVSKQDEMSDENELERVFLNGNIIREYSIDTIRNRAAQF